MESKMAKQDWIEIEKGVFILRDPNKYRPIIKLKLNGDKND